MTAFTACRKTADWLPTARRIGSLVTTLQYHLQFVEITLKHLGGMSPGDLFTSMESGEEFPVLVRRVCVFVLYRLAQIKGRVRWPYFHPEV